MHYKRKIFSIITIIFAFLICFINFSGCSSASLTEFKVYKGFSVHYLDVAQGDCIFINFPDGKNFLIDTGESNNVNENTIKSFLSAYSITKIDNLLLTHPHLDHIGNAEFILQNYQVEKVYLPYVAQALLPQFEKFSKILSILEQKQIAHQISTYDVAVKGEDYFLAFLSPEHTDIANGLYSQFNLSLMPEERQINNLSPIVYLECLGKRFVFTGDALSENQNLVVDLYNAGFYNFIFDKYNKVIDLNNIDYLKLAHHGAENGAVTNFLKLTKPKNVIVSVGANNFNGHPSTETFEKLDNLVGEYNLYRTDLNGNITIYLEDGNFKIATSL